MSKLAITLRAKKLGILIRDARINAGKTKKETGAVIGVSSSSMNSIETGLKSPSLPELELLAYYLGVPLEHFWQDEIRSGSSSLLENMHVEHALRLRNKFIGNILQKTREQKNMTFKELSEAVGIPGGRLKKYETGESAVPIPEMELLCNLLEIPLTSFTDPDTDIGYWVMEQRSIQDFLELPIEVQEFVSKPINKPYLELAQRMSGLDSENLRSVAETLLDITI
ncbi:MAG: helix-turn-helix domain-containing protein [Anaerolineae bacterium]|nr:helix-turn-helix domain-containing protein [Anaerolineae bacterium]